MFPINIQSPRSNNNGQLPLLPNTHYIHARSSFPHAPPMSESVSKSRRKHNMRTKSASDMLICIVSACMHHWHHAYNHRPNVGAQTWKRWVSANNRPMQLRTSWTSACVCEMYQMHKVSMCVSFHWSKETRMQRLTWRRKEPFFFLTLLLLCLLLPRKMGEVHEQRILQPEQSRNIFRKYVGHYPSRHTGERERGDKIEDKVKREQRSED